MDDAITSSGQTSKSGLNWGFRALFAVTSSNIQNIVKSSQKVGFFNKVKLSISWSTDNEKFNCNKEPV